MRGRHRSHCHQWDSLFFSGSDTRQSLNPSVEGVVLMRVILFFSLDNQGTLRAEEEGCPFGGLQEQDLRATLSGKEKKNSSDQRTTLHSPGLQELEVLNQKLSLPASSQAKQAPWPEPPDAPGHLEALPGSGCYSCCVCRDIWKMLILLIQEHVNFSIF